MILGSMLVEYFLTYERHLTLSTMTYFSEKWFCSYLQFTSVKGYQSNMKQGPVFGPLLFILFINDLHLVVQYISVHQFADNTNLLFVEKSLKQLNKKVNRDLKLTVEWVRAKKLLSLNANKTKIIIFTPRNKTISKYLNFRLSGQKIKPTN